MMISVVMIDMMVIVIMITGKTRWQKEQAAKKIESDNDYDAKRIKQLINRQNNVCSNIIQIFLMFILFIKALSPP